jgi:glutathione S-transferase
MSSPNKETVMLKLHGFAVSNYFNMVHLALLEKGVEFEVVTAYPDGSPEFLAHSPRGKVPFLQTEHGYINETSVILDYLEESQGGRALLPADPFARAQVRALMKEIELYIELPARLCFAEAFFGGTVPDAIKAKAEAELRAGFATLKRHAKFAPYVAGDSFTLADILFLYSVSLAAQVAQKLFQFDPLEDIPQARALLQQLALNPHVQKIAAERERAMPAFIAHMQAKR